MFSFNRQENKTEFLYLIILIEDGKVQLVTSVDTVDGVVFSEGKICAVLKRFTPPVDIMEALADMQIFSSGGTAASSAPTAAAPVKPEPKPVPKPEVCIRWQSLYAKDPMGISGYFHFSHSNF